MAGNDPAVTYETMELLDCLKRKNRRLEKMVSKLDTDVLRSKEDRRREEIRTNHFRRMFRRITDHAKKLLCNDIDQCCIVSDKERDEIRNKWLCRAAQQKLRYPPIFGSSPDYLETLRTDHASNKKPTNNCPLVTNFEPSYEFNNTYCAITDVNIKSVDSNGNFIQIVNTNPKLDMEVGSHFIAQMVCTQLMSAFCFPPRCTIPPDGMITVWAANSRYRMNCPPSHFITFEISRWLTNPDCTTILSQADGRAIAWTNTAALRMYDEAEVGVDPPPYDQQCCPTFVGYKICCQRRPSCSAPNVCCAQHPIVLSPGCTVFQCQSHIPELILAGAPGQRLGSRRLLKFIPPCPCPSPSSCPSPCPCPSSCPSPSTSPCPSPCQNPCQSPCRCSCVCPCSYPCD